MNRQQLRDRIISALNESTSAPVFWSEAQLNAVITEGSEILAEECKAIRRTAYVARQAGATYYFTRGVAQDLMAAYRVWLPDLNRRLVAVSISELDVQNEQWSVVTGDPEYWFPISWDCFGVYPKSASGGGVLRVDYLAWPRSLMDDTDEPEFLEADQDSIVIYGVYDGLMKKWDTQRALQLFNRFLSQWEQGRARNGVREQQARAYQRSAGSVPFRSGVVRG